MTYPIISDVITYWDRLRADRDMPDRAEIDPREISDLLSYMFILDRTRPGVVRFRLSGTHLNELMGMEVRGMPVRALFELPERERLMANVERVFTGPSAVHLHLEAGGQGRSALTGRMVLLPLRGTDDTISRALGVLTTEGLIGQPPRRFRVARADATPLLSGQAVLDAVFDADRKNPGLSEAAEPFRGGGPRHMPGKRPRLYVVKGGKP